MGNINTAHYTKLPVVCLIIESRRQDCFEARGLQIYPLPLTDWIPRPRTAEDSWAWSMEKYKHTHTANKWTDFFQVVN